MKNFFICLICFVGAQISYGQNSIDEYVYTNTVFIKSIETDSTNYSDLGFLGRSIGDARIVMLGEQDHGDAPTFLAKTRIIKYLHEVKGFNVLAFESDFFALNEGWDHLAKEENLIDTFLKKNIFPIWTYCSSCKNLFYEYIPSTFRSASPLQISGFDDQLILNYSSTHLWKELDSVLTNLSLPITRDSSYRSDILPLLESINSNYWKENKIDSNQLNRCAIYYQAIKEQSLSKLDSNSFWAYVIENLNQLNTQRLNYERKNQADTTRDFQMSENLKWLTKIKYPNEKIIVWAANAHIIKDDRTVLKNKSFRINSMGRFFTEEDPFRKETYIVGFDSYEGMSGRLGGEKYKIKKPKSSGFENWISPKLKFAFVDFKKYNPEDTRKPETFCMKALGNINMKLEWTKLFDGIFFIREMYPCIPNPR